MTWLTVIEYLSPKWQQISLVCRNHNPVLSSFMTCIQFVTRVTWLVPCVEQELLTLSKHLSSLRVLVGFMFLDFLFSVEWFVNLCLFVCLFSFLFAIVFSILLRYMASDYPFGISKRFFIKMSMINGLKCTKALS